MRCRWFCLILLLLGWGAVSCQPDLNRPSPALPPTKVHAYSVTGVVQSVKADGLTAVIAHEEIPAYMEAMTMPFRAKNATELSPLRAGDRVSFRLQVTDEESWIEGVTKIGQVALPDPAAAPSETNNLAREFHLSRIPDFALTNEFREPISLRQFQGQALALSFFFTRCPIPEYCPRLSKNFAEATRRLKAIPNAPTNWHLLSISFDPFDTPAVLARYAKTYRYDSNHWSFVTGATNDIQRLTRGFGVSVAPGAGIFNHGFLTAVFDASGKLQRMWPVGGDTSEILVQELMRAASVTNLPSQAP